jgi:hypothetical protein
MQYLAVVENGVPFAPNTARIRRTRELFKPRRRNPNLSKLANPDIKPGKGWFVATAAGADNCDGTYDSFCARNVNGCFLSGHNDFRGGLAFDSYSGWLILNLENMRHGVITLKIEDWHPSGFNPLTKEWKCENNECEGRMLREESSSINNNVTTSNDSRRLKAAVPEYCPEFQIDYAIDGAIQTLDVQQWMSKFTYPQRVVQLWTMSDDENLTNGETRDVEFAIRMRGCDTRKQFRLTHIYWA